MTNYKIIGIIPFLAGATYSARAFRLIRVPGELPMTNTYLLVIGILFCVSALGVYICGNKKQNEINPGASAARGAELLITLLCFIVFTLTFEKAGTIKASFIFSLILGTIWNRNPASGEVAQKFNLTAYLKANKIKTAENIFASCVSAAGIWLVFERIFSLSLP